MIQNQLVAQNAIGEASKGSGNLGNVPQDMQNNSWIWDIGFPSVMPIDLNFYQIPDGRNLEI